MKKNNGGMWKLVRTLVCIVACVAMLFSVVGCKPSGDPSSDDTQTTAETTDTGDTTAETTEASAEDTTADTTSDTQSAGPGTDSTRAPTTRPQTTAQATAAPTSPPVNKEFTKLNGVGKVWMMPSNAKFYELVTNMDQWKTTRSVIDVIAFGDGSLEANGYNGAQINMTRLEEGFAALRKANLPLGLEVGAIKEWGYQENNGVGTYYGEKIFRSQNVRWKRYIDAGADFVAIAMDEPLTNLVYTGKDAWGWVGNTNDKLEFAAVKTAEFIKCVREEYPHMVVGNIEGSGFSPSFLKRYITRLNDETKKQSGKGLDFFRMDVDWIGLKDNPVALEQKWREMKDVEDHCRSIGVAFSMIYWGADAIYKPGAENAEANNKAFHDWIMRHGRDYKAVGGKPDQYVIQTWTTIQGVAMPPFAIPETKANTFTQSLLEFYDTFIK